MSPRRALTLLLVTSALACGSATTPPPDHARHLQDRPPAGDASVEAPPAPRLEVAGTGASEAEAYADARRRLADELLGDAEWLDLVTLEVHDRARDDYTTSAAPDGAVGVTLGLSTERVDELLAAFAEAEVQVEAPQLWVSTLTTFALGHLAVHVCERRRVLLERGCDPPAPEVVDAALRALASSVELRSLYEGGVPLAADGSTLRPPTVLVTVASAPVAHVPLLLLEPGAESTAPPSLRSDADGHLELPTLEAADGSRTSGWRVVLDAHALLGPLHRKWPVREFTLAGRPTSLQRYSAVVTEHARGHATPDGVVAATLTRELGQRGIGAPLELPANVQRQLVRANPQQRRRRLIELADEHLGRLDVVLLVDADSEFASRMGGSRVWYEARGSLAVLDAWTGAELTRLEATVTASGVGDQRADRAARQKLAQDLVRQLLQSRGPRSTASAAAPVVDRAYGPS